MTASEEQDSPSSRLFHRWLAGHGQSADNPRVIDCVATGDGRIRVFCGAGVGPGTFDLTPALGFAVIESATEVAGAALLQLRRPGRLRLADGSAASIEPTDAEPGILSGLKTLMGSRIAESPAAIADWLRYHHQHHGAEAALILNRAPQDAAFVTDLSVALADLHCPVVLVESPLPLGRPDGIGLHMPPYQRPNKDDAKPQPDAWRSAFAEPLIYEALKWRFLTDAAAVLLVDCCDVLSPETANAFDLCQSTRGGVISLRGTPCFPWRPRDMADVRIGDHICRQFNSEAAIGRWGVAPRRAGLQRIWRLARIVGPPASLPVVPFWRAMGIRVPNQPASLLAPKASLVEDDRLVALSTEILGHKPVRVPVSALRTLETKAPDQLRTTIVGCMKNEGPFLLEWIAYHRAIGVNDFLIYTNDCTDGTDTFLSLLQDKGIVQHRANPWVAGSETSPQAVALDLASAEEVVQKADWLISMDVDEFINIKLGNGTLAELYAAIGDGNLVSLTWRLFGDSSVVAYEDRPIIGQFDRCAPEIIRKPHQAWGFKTLFRNIEIFKKLGLHRPKGLKPEHWEQIRWLNGSGRPMPKSVLLNGWRSTLSSYGYDWVQLNHYAVRSVESFLVKRARGRAYHVDRGLGSNYWFRMSHNADQDTSIMRMLPALQAELDRLMSDPDIARAHQFSVARHREKITELMQQPEQQDFYAELTGERMRRLTRLQKHFGSAVFAVGPQVIPDEIALNPDLPGDFFFTVDHPGGEAH
jgi:hypothetical protein